MGVCTRRAKYWVYIIGGLPATLATCHGPSRGAKPQTPDHIEIHNDTFYLSAVLPEHHSTLSSPGLTRCRSLWRAQHRARSAARGLAGAHPAAAHAVTQSIGLGLQHTGQRVCHTTGATDSADGRLGAVLRTVFPSSLVTSLATCLCLKSVLGFSA